MKNTKTYSRRSPRIRLVRMISLGCPKNLVDAGIAAGSFVVSGFGLTADENEADVIWINTCAFLRSAREEASDVIREALVWKSAKRGRKVVVGGCFIKWDAENGSHLSQMFPEVDAWLGIDSPADTGSVLNALFEKKKPETKAPANSAKWICDSQTPRILVEAEHFAYLKISDGCDNCCTYCLIPSIRGSLRSRTVDDVIREAKSLIGMGVRELILIAQDTGGFGRDLDGHGHLGDLLDAFNEVDGDYLIRLMYLHPRSITDNLLAAMKRCKHLIPHLEMPVQHVSEHMLQSMNRHLSAERQKEVLQAIREAGFTIRTTLMTGFPGETEDDFAELKHAVEDRIFDRIGVFAYSPEPGTPASEMTDILPEGVGEKRRDILLEMQNKISVERNRLLKGSDVPAILDCVEENGKGTGRLFADAPDIDQLLHIRTLPEDAKPGDLLLVHITGTAAYDIRGTFLDFYQGPASL